MADDVLQLIERGNLVDRIVNEIVGAVVAEQFPPEARLVEVRLGEELGISRGPVREAFRRLEQMGLVVKVLYRGTFVTTLTADDVRELRDRRAPLGGLAVRLLAEKRDPAGVAQLAGILEAMQQQPAPGDPSRRITFDVDFHDTLIALSGHRLLEELWLIVGVRLRRFLMLKRQRLYKTPQEAVTLHQPIVQAIAAGAVLAAEEAVRRHITKASERHLGVWNDAV